MLLSTVTAFSITFILPLVSAFPSTSFFQPTRRNQPISVAILYGQFWCSADSSKASVVPFAQDPGWVASMMTCLSRLNAPNWDGTECVPTAANGTRLGPTFGFWMAKKNNWKGQILPSYCYQLCLPCLQSGINKQQAVTTRCSYEFTKVKGIGCDIGFDYGQWGQA